MFGEIDHIGVAVEDLDATLEIYNEKFEMAIQYREVVESQGVEPVLLEVGGGHIELLKPLGPDTPVGKFIEKHVKELGAPIALKGFVKFEVGEGIEKAVDDFAAEVASMQKK